MTEAFKLKTNEYYSAEIKYKIDKIILLYRKNFYVQKNILPGLLIKKN